MGHCFLRLGLAILFPVIFLAPLAFEFGFNTVSLCMVLLLLLLLLLEEEDDDVLYCLSAALTRLSKEEMGGRAKLLLVWRIVLLLTCVLVLLLLLLLFGDMDSEEEENLGSRLNFSMEDGSWYLPRDMVELFLELLLLLLLEALAVFGALLFMCSSFRSEVEDMLCCDVMV